MDLNFWKGKKVFLTGHTGFKGSWLSIWLLNLGAIVEGYSLAPEDKSLFNIAKLNENLISTNSDIRDYDNLLTRLKTFKPDIVLHLAAQAIVRKSYINPRETYSTNIMGLLNLLEVVREIGTVKAFVNVTSDKCYENKEWIWGYRETDAMGGYDPYSSSKGCAELLTSSYRRSFFNPKDFHLHGCGIASARAGNVIGGGDWAEDRLVPDILKALETNDLITIRNPNAIRPWQHVLEPLYGYLILTQKLYENGQKYADGWNFGPSPKNELTVGTVAKMLADEWGKPILLNFNSSEQLHEANILKLDCTKAMTELDWYPKWDMQIVTRKIIAWHRAWLNHENMFEYCSNEINNYLKQEVN